MQIYLEQILYILAYEIKYVPLSFFIMYQQLAAYLCTGVHGDPDEYHHYALNVPLYTHFTSPIRRYADVVVHRQLAYTLGKFRLNLSDSILSGSKWSRMAVCCQVENLF